MNKKKLRDFIVEESANLAFLEERLRSFNIFDVLNISHREIRHSNFIGWLLDPNENHGFGDYFLLQFLNALPDVSYGSLIEYNINDLSSTLVKREKENNIDIFILNRDLSFSITIENKVHSTDSKGQLKKYFTYVNEKYDELGVNYFVYLTPFGSIPKDKDMRDVYQCFSYKELIRIIEKGASKFESTEEEIQTSLKQYIDNVKRNVLNMDDTNKIAQKIYRKHREVIDFIVDNKPDLSDTFQDIKKYIEEEDRLVLLTPDDKSFVRFLPNNEKFLNSLQLPKARSWRSCPYIFTFELHFWQEEIHLKFCFGGLYPKDEQDIPSLQKEKTRLFKKMKNLPSIKMIVSKRSKSTSRYPAIAWKEVMNIQQYLKDDGSDKMIDVFNKNFKEILEDLILPFVEEFNKV